MKQRCGARAIWYGALWLRNRSCSRSVTGKRALDFKRKHPNPIALALIEPVEELRHGIDLIVMASVRELQQLPAKFVEPFGAPGQMNVAGLDLCGLGMYAGCLVDLRPEGNWIRYADFLPKILDERRAGAHVLNHDPVGTYWRAWSMTMVA